MSITVEAGAKEMWVVDIETNTVTELPWLADSMPSWQRAPSG